MRKINEDCPLKKKKRKSVIIFSSNSLQLHQKLLQRGRNKLFFYAQVATARSNELKLPARELNWIQGKIFSDAKTN